MNLHLRLQAGRKEEKTVELHVDEFFERGEQTHGTLWLVRLDSGNVGWNFQERGGVEAGILPALLAAQELIEAQYGVHLDNVPQPIRGVDNMGIWAYLGEDQA